MITTADFVCAGIHDQMEHYNYSNQPVAAPDVGVAINLISQTSSTLNNAPRLQPPLVASN